MNFDNIKPNELSNIMKYFYFFDSTTIQRLGQKLSICLAPFLGELETHNSQNSFNKWNEISSLDIIIFELKDDGKKWFRIYFEIH